MAKFSGNKTRRKKGPAAKLMIEAASAYRNLEKDVGRLTPSWEKARAQRAPVTSPVQPTALAAAGAATPHMRWNDAIDLTQQLIRTCKMPGLLSSTWGTHSLSSEGPVWPDRPALTQAERDKQFDNYVRERIPNMLNGAAPFFVDRALVDTIERTAPTLPPEARLHPKLFKVKQGCLFFERPIKMPPRRLIDVTGHPTHEPAPMSGFAWQQDGTMVVLIFIYSWAIDSTMPNYYNGTYIGNVPLAVSPWVFDTMTLSTFVSTHNKVIRDNPGEDDTNNAERFVISSRVSVATLLLMDQILTIIDTEPVDRYARKRAEKAGWTQPTTVQVVKLRRVDRVNLYEHTRDVTWHVRWQVAEHWRTLKRGTPDERTVLVHAYIKGPPDAPFKPPNPKVFAVVR